MAEEFFIHQFDNGLVLLGDRLGHVVSTAINIALPAGSSRDGQKLAGAGTVLTDWLFRGAGDRDSRQLNDALDSLGCHHDEHIQSTFLQLTASQIHQQLRQVLGIYADILLRPGLEAKTFGPCRELALQDLLSLEEEPTRKCNMRLRERFYPAPLGVSAMGTEQSLTALTSRSLRSHALKHINPHGAIMTVAGRFEWEEVLGWVTELLGAWKGKPLKPITLGPVVGGVGVEEKPTSQMQISLAYPAPMAGDPHYYPMRVAEMVLSGGMSGRLFTEVREKRGLVYHVGARYQGVKQAAGIFVYAGTAPARAQQTLEVTVAELRRLAKGVSPEELARSKTQLKSALIMQGESTAARAGGLVADWHLLGRLRSLEEIAAAIDAVTQEDILACLAAYPARNITAYILGPEKLDTTCLQS